MKKNIFNWVLAASILALIAALFTVVTLDCLVKLLLCAVFLFPMGILVAKLGNRFQLRRIQDRNKEATD